MTDYTLFSITVTLSVLATILRNNLWKDESILWGNVLKKCPGSAGVHENFGCILMYYMGRVEEGNEHLQIALRINPNLPENIMLIGLDYSSRGMIDMAFVEFNAVLLRRPDSAEAHYNLGIAYDRKGWMSPAIEQSRVALKLKSDYANACNNLRIAYGVRGLIDEAIETFHAAIKIRSEDASFHYNLDRAFRTKGLNSRAEEEILKARGLENGILENSHLLPLTVLVRVPISCVKNSS